ncbi:MAG TPA: NAD kinase [Microbacteriaceae bacterium]|nr:NAD kinase [Microbacteriaceae bacterium]
MAELNAARRAFLVIAHTGREESVRAAREAIAGLLEAGAVPVLPADDSAGVISGQPGEGACRILGVDVPLEEIELAIVLGGDGTILRAAEVVRPASIPIIGVNLGHVGFLAEAEREDLHEVVRRAIVGDYEVEERMAIDVVVLDAEDREVYRTWALNEATVEKSTPGKMVEVVIEVGGRPLSSFGCDGVVMATPTGSTAYAFSAGGPVVWPNIDAMLLVPLSAHALFARPLVVAPTSVLAVELLQTTASPGMLWCDGRRSTPLAPGARVEVTRSATTVRLARLSRGQFTDRLVHKFDLPVAGWRGSGRRSPR